MDALIIALAIPVFLIAIGVEAWWLSRPAMRAKLGEPAYRLDDGIASLSCGIGQQVVALFLGFALIGAYGAIYDHARLFTIDPGSIPAWIALLLGVDLQYYWFHRASHRVNFIWATHAVHHQSEEYNLTTALRQSMLQGVMSSVFYWPLALLGFPTPMFVLAITINTLYQFWIHTRGVGKLGPLELVLNTPSHHRVHHGIDPKYIDKNYAGMFIVWDRLFGTFLEEEEEPVYGTVKPLASYNPIWANLQYWVEIGKLVRACPRFVDKLRAPFMPPEWRPAELGGPVVIPHVSAKTRPKYAPYADRATHIYAIASFALVVIGASTMIALGASMAPAMVVLIGAALLTAMATIAGLVEAQPWARPIETARLLAQPLSAGLLFYGSPWFVPIVTVAIAISLAMGAGLSRLGQRPSQSIEAGLTTQALPSHSSDSHS